MSQATLPPIRFRNPDHARQVLEHCERVSQRCRRFVVECRALDGAFYIREIDCDRTNLEAVIADILAGQCRPCRVYELSDVSGEVAVKLAQACCSFEVDPGPDAKAFLALHEG